MTSFRRTTKPPVKPGATESPQRIRECARCGVSLRLQAPTIDTPAIPWLCNGCGSVYFASWHGGPGEGSAGGCRLQPYDQVLTVIISHLDVEADSLTKAQAEAFARRGGTHPPVGAELRKRSRSRLVTPVIAIPLGNDFRVSGRPARMFTIDVSQSGIRLVHAKGNSSPMLALDFTDGDAETVSVILNVRRVRSVGGVYEIAGPMISRIVRTP